jgi:uncharacterized protein
MFSLENGREVRFHTRSRLFTDAESAALPPLGAPESGWIHARPAG